jgi:uncharacterized protein YxeA
MAYKSILATAVASAFAFSSLGAYAQQDEKKDEKKPYVVSQSDETKKPEQSDEKKDEKKPYVVSQSDEKEPKKPDLIS